LHQAANRLDHDPLPWHGLDDHAIDIGKHIEDARRFAQEHLPGHSRNRFECAGNRGRNFGLEPFDQGLVLGQSFTFLDAVAHSLDQVFDDFTRSDPKLIRQIERIHFARQLRSRHRLIGPDAIAGFHQHGSGNR